MAIELNKPALEHARALVRDGKVVRDERDAWSEAAPTPDEENAFIEDKGWTEYSHWHIGIDKSENRETKGAYSFPFGDFRRRFGQCRLRLCLGGLGLHPFGMQQRRLGGANVAR